jgi:hypothetical protein
MSATAPPYSHAKRARRSGFRIGSIAPSLQWPTILRSSAPLQNQIAHVSWHIALVPKSVEQMASQALASLVLARVHEHQQRASKSAEVLVRGAAVAHIVPLKNIVDNRQPRVALIIGHEHDDTALIDRTRQEPSYRLCVRHCLASFVDRARASQELASRMDGERAQN